MILTGENRRTLRKISLSATLSTTNPMWIDPSVDLVLRSEKTATKRLSHGTAYVMLTMFPLGTVKAFLTRNSKRNDIIKED
jgi:hypothetical protein